MKIDYKITTIVLAAILTIWLLWTTVGYAMMWSGMGARCEMKDRDNYTSEERVSKWSKTDGMHMMSNGQMMSDNMMGSSVDKGKGSGASMMNMMMDMTAGMKGKSGKELEKVFLKEMIIHHQGAIDMAKLLLMDKTIRPELKTFAEGIISAQNPEIEQMTSWLKAY